ncbi:MAG: carboxypeptidase-like regulatory domain-containing protein [Saprospiraceae bacterium]|nr:carboxypeptidase-like regulatory domain-containing protein [Candidatus Vicinibacter proximus]MCC6843046.1 carboxypeptidase-like regulatory domain-containing protein [Saprospiraceae bacterium]HRG31944.1 carboxypeptidase-like regulatory domain-containing protein [Saprospiraceae bacterium]
MRVFVLFIAFLFWWPNYVFTQNYRLVQLSGMVMTDSDGEPKPLPFAEISILNTSRGVYSDVKGFFSLAVENGDTLVFNYIGFKPAYFTVPDSLHKDHYTIFQIMTRDTIFLPQTVVYPWPDREFFRQEFLAMDISKSMEDIAAANLAQDKIRRLMEITPADGRETSSLYLSQNAQKYYYAGQFKPMQILNPMAWIEFFKAWKRGDFRKK